MGHVFPVPAHRDAADGLGAGRRADAGLQSVGTASQRAARTAGPRGGRARVDEVVAGRAAAMASEGYEAMRYASDAT